MNDSGLLREPLEWLHCLKENFLAAVHPARRRSIHCLTGMKDIYRGQRCFIIGNGPSLKQTDLSLLKNEYTFGLNRIYLLFPELGFTTTYLVAVNRLVIEQCAQEILAVPVDKFIPWSLRNVISPRPDVIFLNLKCAKPGFATDVRGQIWTGATVTYVAMQLAFFLGFEKVVLIGVDHSFASQGRPHMAIVSEGNDPDHFAPNYFGKGFKWQLPDLETSEIAYRMARQAFERDGREILDATIGGKLAVFPKADYSSLF